MKFISELPWLLLPLFARRLAPWFRAAYPPVPLLKCEWDPIPKVYVPDAAPPPFALLLLLLLLLFYCESAFELRFVGLYYAAAALLLPPTPLVA